jgi:hypothetical protein
MDGNTPFRQLRDILVYNQVIAGYSKSELTFLPQKYYKRVTFDARYAMAGGPVRPASNCGISVSKQAGVTSLERCDPLRGVAGVWAWAAAAFL